MRVHNNAEYYKKMSEQYQETNIRLQKERNNAFEKLQSLYTLYNIQRKTIQELEREKIDLSDDSKTLEKHIDKLNAERRGLSVNLNKEILVWKEKALRYKNDIERLKGELSEVKKVVENGEDEITIQKHKLISKEGELKEQLETKEKDIELVKLQANDMRRKMEEQIFVLTEEREQLLSEIRNLKYKIENIQQSNTTPKEENFDEFFENERKLKKEVTRLNIENEGLKEENEKLKEQLENTKNKGNVMNEYQNINKKIEEITKLMKAEQEERTIKENAIKEQAISELASSILSTATTRRLKPTSREDNVHFTKRVKLTLTKHKILQ
jgi:chromosome segregation ATPase